MSGDDGWEWGDAMHAENNVNCEHVYGMKTGLVLFFFFSFVLFLPLYLEVKAQNSFNGS